MLSGRDSTFDFMIYVRFGKLSSRKLRITASADNKLYDFFRNFSCVHILQARVKSRCGCPWFSQIVCLHYNVHSSPFLFKAKIVVQSIFTSFNIYSSFLYYYARCHHFLKKRNVDFTLFFLFLPHNAVYGHTCKMLWKMQNLRYTR